MKGTRHSEEQIIHRGVVSAGVQAVPKRHDKYLFEGKVWIDVEDYAVVRIEGHPAKKLSFWIQRADFVRQYQKIEGFWFPQRDRTFVDVRLYGKKVLTIDHHDYSVNSSVANNGSIEGVRRRGARRCDQSSSGRRGCLEELVFLQY